MNRRRLSVCKLRYAAALVIALWLATSAGSADAAIGDLMRTVNLASGAQCPGTATSVAMVPGGVVGLPQYPTLLVTSCPNDSRLFFTDPAVNAPVPAPPGWPLVLTVTMVNGPGPNDLVPSVGFGSLALRGDKADLVGCANNNNHIHAVWRDFEGDFGEDLLLKHYQEVAHP